MQIDLEVDNPLYISKGLRSFALEPASPERLAIYF
jgi:hypothetical protein